MTSSASPGEPRPATARDSDRERYGWAIRIYAAAHDEHPRWVEQSDGGYQDVGELLGDMMEEQVATLSELLGLPPDEERSDADISDEIIRMRAELDHLRVQRDAVLALHRPVSENYNWCRICCMNDPDQPLGSSLPDPWPCDTARALGVSE